MENFNALLTLNEIKTLYSGKPVGICPLYKGVLGATKTFEATGNPIVLPEYKSLVKLTTQFSPKQAGTGDPSPENVRPISGWDSVKVTISNESESHDYDIALPETIYGGTADAVTGVGSNLYIFKELAIVDMDNAEDFPGWTNQEWVAQALPGEIRDTSLADLGCEGLLNIDARLEFRFTPEFVLYLYPATNNIFPGLTQSQIKEQYPDLKVQFCLKLVAPEPFENSQISIPSLGGENKFFTNAENMDIIYNETSFWG